jgi:hypothetical protein
MNGLMNERWKWMLSQICIPYSLLPDTLINLWAVTVLKADYEFQIYWEGLTITSGTCLNLQFERRPL